MSKYIRTHKEEYNLDIDKTMVLIGEVNRLNWLTSYKYDIYIGSGGTEFRVASGKTASEISDGIEIAIEKSGKNNFAKIASPTGQSCYIRAKGEANGKTAEYMTYISLKAPGISMPKGFELKLEASNNFENGVTEFGNCAVKGFSSLKATLTDIDLNYDAHITRISFSSLLFKDITYGIDDEGSTSQEQTAVSDSKVDVSGNYEVFCTVTNSFGYSVTEKAAIYVSNYGTPELVFDIEPYRTTDNKGTKLERKDVDKNRLYGLRTEFSVLPYPVTDKDGRPLNKIVSCEKVTLTDTLTGAEATLFTPLSGSFRYEISQDGELTASYLSEMTGETADTPVFVDKEGAEYNGLATFKSYKLKVTVTDTTGNRYTLSKTVKSMLTTFHLKRGGRGAKFGGYAEQDDVLESDWKIQGNDIIEAYADDTVKEPGGKGTVKGEFFVVGKQLKFGKETVTGIGKESGHLARGNHSHGLITADGTADTANAVIISNGNKSLEAAKHLPTYNLTIENDPNKLMPCAGFTVSETEMETYIIPGSAITVKANKLILKPSSAGSSGEAVRADHEHPYSREWMNDPIYIETIKTLSIALSNYL